MTAADQFENVTRLERDGKEIYIVGTAHVSQQSVDEVSRVIDAIKPDTVCVELCQTRYAALTDNKSWQELDLFKVIREGKTLFLMASLAIGAYQRRLGRELGIKPGAEMLAAATKAREIGADVSLVDRDIRITLKRTWSNLSFRRKVSLIGAILTSLVSHEKISSEQVEQLKEQAHLSELMREFARQMPDVQQPLIDERDRYMMASIERAEGNRIVAIVGAGHVEGMCRYFGQPTDLDQLKVTPPAAKWTRALKWVIPLVILAAFARGLMQHQGSSFEQMLYAWVLPNSIAAAGLTALAGGKILSILTALVGSPITSLNPLLGAGMVVGLVEAWQRKPTVEDAERINEDVESLAGIYRNPFTRVLLVAVMSTIGSALGAWIGGAWVLSLL
jgi:pheromone shutdown-related protein TraB